MGNGCSASADRRIESESEYETDDEGTEDTATAADRQQQTPLLFTNAGATATAASAAANTHAPITSGGRTQNVKPGTPHGSTGVAQASGSKKSSAAIDAAAAAPPMTSTTTTLQPTSPAPSNQYASPKGRMQYQTTTSQPHEVSDGSHQAAVPPGGGSSAPTATAVNPLHHPSLSGTAVGGTSRDPHSDAMSSSSAAHTGTGPLRPAAPTPPSVPMNAGASGAAAAPRRAPLAPGTSAVGHEGPSAAAAAVGAGDTAHAAALPSPLAGAAAVNRLAAAGGSSVGTQQPTTSSIHSPPSSKKANKKDDVPVEDICTQLPRRLQLKAIRSVTLTVCSRDVAQPNYLQPAVLIGALGDMRGERLRYPHQYFSLRKLLAAGPVILRYRLSHLLSQVQEASKAKGEAPKKPLIGYGSCVKEPVFALWLTGPPLIESPEMRRRTETSRMTLQKVGMYAVSHYMPCTLRKGSRRRQRGYFECQRELFSVFTHGADQSACFIANFLPDIFVNLQSFESNVRKALAAAVRVAFHKLFDVLVDREEALQTQRQIANGGGFGTSDGGGGGGILRAPRVDVSAVYIRDDALYAASTIGGAEGQLFSLLDPRSIQIIALESDSQLEATSGDDRSLSSRASFMSDSSANGGSNSKTAGRKSEAAAVQRKYDVPDTMVYRCQLSQFVELLHGIPALPELQFSSPVTPSSSMNGAAASVGASSAPPPRMATFQPAVPATMTSPMFTSAASGKIRFVVVLSTEPFWQTLSKQVVWELLYLLVELDREASQTKVSERPAADVVRALRGPNPPLGEDVVQTLARFYVQRREAHREETQSMMEPAMAQTLVEIAENQAIVDNPDRAARMSLTVIALR